ncbi:MAG: hypothetical protein ABEJ79_10210 [Halolamina sp.]
MTSTALDVGLCLVLVSAAAVSLATVGQPTGSAPTDSAAPSSRSPGHAADAARTLGTVTATVNYDLSAGASCPASPECERHTTGSLAELLAAATMRNATIDGRRLSPIDGEFGRTVRRRVVAATPPRTQVVARWRPYPGSHVRATLRVGPSPPPEASVSAATLSVPSGVDRVDSMKDVPAALVNGLFPPARLRLALTGDAPSSTLATTRYRRAGGLYGVELDDAVETADTETANDRLVETVAERVAADASDRDIDKAELRLSVVRITVRTWGPSPTAGAESGGSGGAGT